MAKIHQLPAVLANQISAGEVVERPASVVKELVENSIDAHSRDIDVEITGSGLSQIKVVDDGSGIEHDDVKRAFQRHATSKIHNRRDLFQVNSLGFRGEALPSIASVANVTLETSTGDIGTKIQIDGGKIIHFGAAEARPGTTVIVKDLFFNTPARLKYMKAPSTELAKITDVVDQLALGHPEIAFALIHNHREMFRTAGRGNLQQVIGSIYGINKIKKMAAVHGHNLDFKLDGYVSLPELTRASRNYISIILNGRYIRNIELTRAIIQGFGSKLMVGRYPIAVLNLKTDPLLIDPNVHPTKRTVRISKENSLCRLIRQVIQQMLAQQNLIPNVMHREHSVQPRYFAQKINSQLDQASQTFRQTPLKSSDHTSDNFKVRKPSATVEIKTVADLKSPAVQNFVKEYRGPQPQPFFNSDFQPDKVTPAESSGKRFPNLLYVGQVHGTYLIAEAPDGMYVIDQHAAQERVNYEYFRQKIGEVSTDEQSLLVPIVLSYSNSDAIKIKQHLDVLQQVGVDLKPFGENSFMINQHPTWFAKGQEKATLQEMIDWVLKNGKISVAHFRAKTAIMMSCKRAIKANEHLSRDQAVTLIHRLSQAEDPFNCPHGRPVLVHFTNYDLEKMFKRVQDPHRANLWK